VKIVLGAPTRYYRGTLVGAIYSTIFSVYLIVRARNNITLLGKRSR